MKPVQVLFEEDLLARLDSDDAVRAHGRSHVLRRLVAGYLKRKRDAKIEAQYREGYGDTTDLGSEFDHWDEEGSWPEE